MDLNKVLCPCKKVTRGDILKAMAGGAVTFRQVKKVTGAGSKCGKCKGAIKAFMKEQGADLPPAKDKDKRKGDKGRQKDKAADKPISKPVDKATMAAVSPAPEADNGRIRLLTVALDCPDPAALADFYVRLLGWQRSHDGSGDWVDVTPPDGGVGIACQRVESHVPPVWPEREGQPQQQLHLDFRVADQEALRAAVDHAIACGAHLADTQYGDGRYLTLVDPAGHPFCLVTE